ncbi:hypothetical protein QOV31_005121 (plasmid) [Agrobacterium fabrum]|nr:hypothetical protein CN09_18580 [Rhizobium rhizogenes]WJK78236.1 hypothetical protein QOV31_005121 [Agrobacterium fabrum]
MSHPGEELVNDREVIIGVDLVRGKDAVFAVDFKDGDRDHEVAGKLEGVGLSEDKIVRHVKRLLRERANPARWLLKRPGDGRDHRETKSKRPQLASGPFMG